MVLAPAVSALVAFSLYAGSRQPTLRDKVTLKYLPTVGETYKYRMTTSTAIETLTSPGAPMPKVGSQTVADMDMKIVSRNGTVTTIKSRMSNVKSTVKGGSPMAAMTSQMGKFMEGKAVQSKIDSSYRLKSAKGTPLGSILGNTVGIFFPDHPVAAGETWRSSVDLGAIMGMGVSYTAPEATTKGSIPMMFKLVKISSQGGKHIAAIHLSIKGDVTIDMKGASMEVHMSGLGDIQIDLATGVTVSSKTSLDIKTEAGVMKMTMHIKQTMEMRN